MLDIFKASQNLEDLELHFEYEGMAIYVQWFRTEVFNSGAVCKRHNHSFFELHLLKEGNVEVRLDNGCFTACAGDFYLNAPGVYHEQATISDGRVLEYCLSFNIIRNKDIMAEASALFSILNNTTCKAFRDTLGLVPLFDIALEEAYFKRIGYYNKIRDIASLLLINTVQCISENRISDYAVPLKSSKGDYRFAQIEKFINDNITTPITVGQLSNLLHLSEKQIARIVQKNAGVSTKDLIIRNKIRKATDLIKSSSLAINEISEVLGFSSEFYFSQYFKKYNGCPPSSLRK